MQKFISVSLLVLFLAGCHSNPRPPILRAKVSAVENNVCVQVLPKNDEQVVLVRIEEVGNEAKPFAKYDIKDTPASVDKCVPSYGYKFEKNHSYNFTTYLESPEKKRSAIIPASRIFTVKFAIGDNHGAIEVREDN